MSSISSPNENEFSHRQGSVTSIPDEDDQITTTSDRSILQKQPELSSKQRLSATSSSSSNGYSKIPNLDNTQSFHMEHEYQTATIDIQNIFDSSHEDITNQSWKQFSGETSTSDHHYDNISESDSTDDITTSFVFQQPSQQQNSIENNIQLTQNSPREISPTLDYETIIRSNNLYFDQNPELIQKPQMITPILYKQNITIKFLKPPSVPQGPLIIREVRPPQPPPPPPLIIRQRPPPPLSPPPIILREKPPQVPVIMTTQVLTKTLPPVPPPPRSVIIEKLPPLPPKPRDVIIERWIPYESSAHKRKVIVQRAEQSKAYPPPKNIIITYDKVEARIIRQFKRLGITPEDPEKYSQLYGNSLLDTKDLLIQAQELGITEDISPPRLIDYEFRERSRSNSLKKNISHENLSKEKRSSNSSYTTDKSIFSDIDNNTYIPTYENLLHGLSSSINNDQENNEEDLSIQLAQYGLTTESIPY